MLHLAILKAIGDNLVFLETVLDAIVLNPQTRPKFCMIWLHGLGASANDMQSLAQCLPAASLAKQIFLNAPVRPITINHGMSMQAWYDILGDRFNRTEDRSGILASEAVIHQWIARQMAEGFQASQIVLAGFSQGGAMALFSAIRSQYVLGGVVSLSAYLPLATELKGQSVPDMPVFMAGGHFDSVVLPNWTLQSKNFLLEQGLSKLSWHLYSRDHTVCEAEIHDLNRWLNDLNASIEVLQGVQS